MSERPPRSEHYKRTREEFDDLEIEDKAVFLLEATVTTFARGVETFGRALADQIDRAFTAARHPRGPGSTEGPSAPPPETGAGPAEPGAPGSSPTTGSVPPAGPPPEAGAGPVKPGKKTTGTGPDKETLP